MLGAEVEERDGLRRDRRIADARFPRIKRLDGFDLSVTAIPPATLASLATLSWVTAAQLVNELVEAADERVLARTVARYARLDLLLCDELGYVHLDHRGAELPFQVITERDERGAVGVASNLPFSEWGSVFPDARLAAAVVDRLTYRAHVIETGSESYRLRSGRARKGAARGG